MIELDRNKLWSEFLAVWTLKRIRQMALEEYTNPNRKNAFIYWLESRLDRLGSIYGGSPFKFGVYCRGQSGPTEEANGRIWVEKYEWLRKFGATEQEAFAVVRGRLVEVIDAAKQGNFARVEEIEIDPELKWKVAFLYQDRNEPSLFPIFEKEVLFLEHNLIYPGTRIASTPYHVMYEAFMERNRKLGDVFQVARTLWVRHKARKNEAKS